MSGSKTFPIFKIIAVMCLAIVSIIQITVMVDFASEYTEGAKINDAEYMSVLFYVVGFAFLVSTFFALFSLNKRNSTVIVTSIEFLVIIGLGIFLKESPDAIDLENNVELALVLVIPVIYIYEQWLVAGFSVAALLFGILDLTIGNSFSISTNANECMYCGRPLRPGEKCTCDLDDTYVINDFDTDPENYADDVEKRKCIFCGRLLYGTERCNCPEVKRREAEMDVKRRGGFTIDKPTYTPPPPRDVYPTPHMGYTPTPEPTEKPKKGTFINKAFITKPPMSSDSRGSVPAGRPADLPKSKKPGDERFFSKPNDL